MGVIYRWDDQSRTTMANEYEIGYEEMFVKIKAEGNKRLTAVTFVAEEESVCDEACPSREYLWKIITGAEQHRLANRIHSTD